MKTNNEEQHYRNLKRRMIAVSDARNVTWTGYYATLLGIGGMNPEQVIRNVFNDTNKRFNHEQLALIYNDLEECEDIKPFTQCQIQSDVLLTVTQIGKLSEKINQSFDDKDEITLNEIIPIVPVTRDLYSLVKKFKMRVDETKAHL